MAYSLEDTIRYIRSCLIPSKNMLSLKELEEVYVNIMGETIPYQKLGFENLEKLLVAAKNDFVLSRNKSGCYVAAVVNDKSGHISKMVAKQRNAKCRRSKKSKVVVTKHPAPSLKMDREKKGLQNVNNSKPIKVNNTEIPKQADLVNMKHNSVLQLSRNIAADPPVTDIIEPKECSEKDMRVSCEKDILNRILPMLQKNPEGVLSWPLQAYYVHNFYEVLPEDWLRVMDLDPRVQIEKLSDDFILKYSPSKGIYENVYVTHILLNGDIFVQLRNKCYENFVNVKKQVEEKISKNPPKNTLCEVTRSSNKDKLYLFKHPRTGTWQRVKCIDWSPSGLLAQILFVDDGTTDIIKVTDEKLYLLQPLSDSLNDFPYQAVRVKMQLDRVPSNIAEIASKVLSKNQPVTLQIIGTSEDNLPLVKLFRPNSDCINTSIDLEVAIKKNETTSFVDLGLLEPLLERSDCSGLKCPRLPPIGGNDFYDVLVLDAVSPDNFFLQSVESKRDLRNMMDTLQSKYRCVHPGHLKVERVLPGKIYACKWEDGFWYRTDILKVSQAGAVSGFFCDYGLHVTISVKQIVPLDKEFMELPYQAFKAKLSGIKSTKSSWTVSECVQFRKMVEHKTFRASAINIMKDMFYKNYVVLEVILVDPSTKNGIYIGKEMLRRGLALEK